MSLIMSVCLEVYNSKIGERIFKFRLYTFPVARITLQSTCHFGVNSQGHDAPQSSEIKCTITDNRMVVRSSDFVEILSRLIDRCPYTVKR